MAFRISSFANDQFFDTNGKPAVGYKLFTYAEGTTTKVDTYTNIDGTAKHTNPIILNAMGFPPAPIFLDILKRYKIVLANPTDTDPPTSSLYTVDGIGVGLQVDVNTTAEWVDGGFPTFISATSFAVPGDLTLILTAGRRVKLESGTGIHLGTIRTSTFGAGVTTVTIFNDIGVLDPSLTAFFYGFLSSDGGSVPDCYFSGLTTNFVGPVNIPPTSVFDLLPASMICEYAGSVAPAGWLFTFGQSLLRSDFPALFNALGTTFGAVDGTHFSLPDLRGCLPLGKDDMGGTPSARVTAASLGGANAITLGGRGGEQIHTLTLPESPAHTHLMQGGTTASTGPYTQGAVTFTAYTVASNSAGGGGAHNNMPPWLALNYIIRAY